MNIDKKPLRSVSPGSVFICGFTVSLSLPIENHLAGLATQHRGKALLELREMKAVCDDRLDVEAALQHHGHLVPGFVHLAAVDSFDGEHVEHDFIPIDGDL